MWVNNQTWCSGHVKAFTVVTKRPYHPGACNICLIKAYFGLLSNGANAKIKTKQQLLIYKFVLNWKVPALQIVTMIFFKLTKKIRARRYLIATSLMIISSSILGVFAPVEFRSQSDLSVPGMLCSVVTSLSIWVLDVLDVVLPSPFR